ncbi:hypothetical protein ZHAS_00005901 [Anopheles sinensis]|uniref:Secreted protein n=1 Tax=Anopheles sinensis TaxID=74873 RepID=A0A084VKK1_ANOSI|nr:hypothetical protein ZHAS_00005901 [Anopheles sinensis]
MWHRKNLSTVLVVCVRAKTVLHIDPTARQTDAGPSGLDFRGTRSPWPSFKCITFASQIPLPHSVCRNAAAAAASSRHAEKIIPNAGTGVPVFRKGGASPTTGRESQS